MRLHKVSNIFCLYIIPLKAFFLGDVKAPNQWVKTRHGHARPNLKIKLNPVQHKPWFLRVCSASLLKTTWEKEKLPIMSKFHHFSHCFLLV